MTQFQWEPEYAIGHAEIDTQHMGIVNMLNRLYRLIDSPPASDRRGQEEELFDQLAAYISSHFAYEEELMLQSGYPVEELAAHKRTHDALLAKVQKIVMAHGNGDEGAMAELLPFLYGDWLIEHICGTDKLYAGYVVPAEAPG